MVDHERRKNEKGCQSVLEITEPLKKKRQTALWHVNNEYK